MRGQACQVELLDRLQALAAEMREHQELAALLCRNDADPMRWRAAAWSDAADMLEQLIQEAQ